MEKKFLPNQINNLKITFQQAYPNKTNFVYY